MSIEEKIVAWLLKMQIRGLDRDDSHGLMNTSQVAGAVGLTKKEARPLLERMAAEGLIRKNVYSNGFAWRTINPLPWEPGGSWPEDRRKALAEAPAIDLAYSRINALGGTVKDADTHGKGYCQAIDDVLGILTDLGAKNAPYAALLADAERQKKAAA